MNPLACPDAKVTWIENQVEQLSCTARKKLNPLIIILIRKPMVVTQQGHHSSKTKANSSSIYHKNRTTQTQTQTALYVPRRRHMRPEGAMLLKIKDHEVCGYGLHKPHCDWRPPLNIPREYNMQGKNRATITGHTRKSKNCTQWPCFFQKFRLELQLGWYCLLVTE